MAEPESAHASRFERIRTLSSILSVACLVLAVLLPLCLIYHWLTSPVAQLAAQSRIPPEWLRTFDVFGRLGALLVTAVPLVPLVWALVRVRACFDAFRFGWLFSAATAGGLRDFSLGVLVSALLGIPATMVLSVWMSWGAPAGHRQLAISVNSDTLLMLLFAGLTAVIAWVLGEAAAVAEENAAFV